MVSSLSGIAMEKLQVAMPNTYMPPLGDVGYQLYVSTRTVAGRCPTRSAQLWIVSRVLACSVSLQMLLTCACHAVLLVTLAAGRMRARNC